MGRHVGQPLRVGEVVFRPGTFFTCCALHNHSSSNSPPGRSRGASNRPRSPPSPPCRPPRREEHRQLAQALSGRGEALFGHLHLTVGVDDATARDDRVPMDVEPGDPVSDPLHLHHLHHVVRRLSGKDLAKRNLGFVLVATVEGPPRSPRQTNDTLSAARKLGDHARQPPPAFHRSRVAAKSWGLTSNPRRVVNMPPQWRCPSRVVHAGTQGAGQRCWRQPRSNGRRQVRGAMRSCMADGPHEPTR